MKKLLLCALICAPLACSHAVAVAAPGKAETKNDLRAASKRVKRADFDPLLPTPGGDSLLNEALLREHAALALILIDGAKTDACLRNPNPDPFLARAANWPVLQRFVLRADFNPNGAFFSKGDRNSDSLLFAAINDGNLEGVRALLAHPNIQPNDKQKSPAPTPTQAAWLRVVARRDLGAARKMAKAPDFDPLLKLPTREGDSLLAAALKNENPTLALLLMDAAKSDDYARDDAVASEATDPVNLAVLRRLLSRPDFDPNLARGGWNPQPLLGQAVGWGNIEGVRALLKHPKIHVNATEAQFGKNALHQAIGNNPNSAAVVALLLADSRFLPDQPDDTGSTALYWLAFFGRPDVVRLVAADPRVDVNLASKVGAPLDMAMSKDMANVKELMDSGKVVVTPKQSVALDKLRAEWGLSQFPLLEGAK